MVSRFFAVVPDGGLVPIALFVEIEEAILWGLERYGSDRFRIRACCTLDGEGAAEPGRRGGQS